VDNSPEARFRVHDPGVPPPRPIPRHFTIRPFTYAEAVGAGLSLRVLQSQRFRRLHREVYISADIELTLDVRIRAALLILPPDTVVTSVTALRLRGLEVGRDRRLHFSTTHPHRLLLDGVVVHRRKRAALRTLCCGLPTTTPAQTFVEAARHLSLVDRVIAGDWLVHRQKVTLAGLQRFVDVVHDHGVRRARRAMVWVRERVESPRESVLRLMVVFARLPEPEPNVPLGDQDAFVGRPDLVYLRYRVIVEYDGLYHLRDRAQQNRDLRRRERLEELGWRVIVVTAEGMRQPREVVWRIYRALRDRGYQGPPPVFDDMWNAWFAAG
jgi:G:T-mismatch repair DNA endonuclease (very short patch repair protein)